ncbi:50S ribosomal protein L10 [Candidatus Pacearchaeota archaeon]|nr:50S ribosomal protein L10 [Candidatus Pacearchaeota archaeon]
MKSKSVKKKDSSKREKNIPQYKLKAVSELVDQIKTNRTVLVASTRKLPSSQFHQIKKQLRGKASIRVVKKSLVIRAMENSKLPGIKALEESVGSDVALFFSELDPFELSGLLADNQSPAKAKAGDIMNEDIHVEPGPTELVPGPAISELSGVGLKVAVEGGKLAIKQHATIARAGEAIKDNVASVMAKLGIMPLKVGFEPLAAYDSTADKVYKGIKIDKKRTLEALREAIGKSRSFAINLKYLSSDTVGYFISKAGLEAKAIEKILNAKSESASVGEIQK